MRRYVRLGLPSGLEVFIGMGTFNVFLLLFQSYGIAEGAAMAIVFQLGHAVFRAPHGPEHSDHEHDRSLRGRRRYVAQQRGYRRGLSARCVCYSGFMGIMFMIFREACSACLPPRVRISADSCRRRADDGRHGDLRRGGLADPGKQRRAARGAGDTRWLMMTSVTIHVLMLAVQVLVILVLELGPLVSWWVFVATLLSQGGHLPGARAGRALAQCRTAGGRHAGVGELRASPRAAAGRNPGRVLLALEEHCI
jgi:MATE family multidrug resistance protein